MARRTFTDSEKMGVIKVALKLHDEGLSWEKIGKEVGVSRETLRKWVVHFQRTSPIKLYEARKPEGTLEDWEREELNNLERLNAAYITALTKVEDLINSDKPDKDRATAIKALIDALTNVFKGLTEVGQLLSVKRRVRRISEGSQELAEVRKQLKARYGVQKDAS